MSLGNKKSNWFPGHMKLTKNLIKTSLKKVDLIINLIDARAPFSSMNFSILKLVEQKPFVVFLTKADLADDVSTTIWLNHIKTKFGFFASALSCKNSNQVEKSFNLACAHLKTIKSLKFGDNMIRIMVVGISNVGKSTLINSFSGSKKAKVENRPGVTRALQWIFLKNGVSLLDTPGVLPIEAQSDESQFALQLIGAIKREKIEVENLAIKLLNHLKAHNIEFFKRNFPEKLAFFSDAFEWLSEFAHFKGMVLKGNEPDLFRASNFLVDGFQSGKFGRITLELPDSFQEEGCSI